MRLSLAATMEAAAPTNLEPEAATLGPDAPVLDDLPPLWQRWNTDMAAYTPLLDELA